MSCPSFFSRLPPTPEPFHLKLVREFPLDPSPIKKTYLFGTYRGEDSGPFVMPEVKQAEVDLANEDEERKESREEISRK